MGKRKASSPSPSTNLLAGPRQRIAKAAPVSILPKPPAVVVNETSSSRHPLSRSQSAGRLCRVPQCPNPDCRLVSHRHYAAASQSHDKSTHAGRNSEAIRRVIVGDRDGGSELALIRGGVDGMPALPLDGLDVSIGRKLFHTFFCHQYPRLVRIMVPPPLSETQRSIESHIADEVLSTALSAPIFCLNIIAAAHYEETLKESPRELDRLTATLRAKLVSLLRHELDDFHNIEIIDAVNVVLTLVIFEAATDNLSALKAHRNAMECLVSSQGGLAKMARVLPYTLSLDRMLSTLVNLPSCFPIPYDGTIRRPPRCPNIYGSFFKDWIPIGVDEGLVIDYCSDLCRAIELLEHECWNFEPLSEDQAKRSDLHYLFYLREVLANDFVILNAKLAHQTSISRCVLLAARIVDLAVLFDNYLIIVPLHLSNIIRHMLCELKPKFRSSEQVNITIWILFVLLSVPSWSGREWAIMMLREQLKAKYAHDKWPSNWRYLEQDNLSRFVWSRKRLLKSWDQACDDLHYDELVLSKPASNVATSNKRAGNQQIGRGIRLPILSEIKR